LLAASPTGSNSISELASKNLAFPSTPVATTCLSPTVLDRHSRTLNHADLGWVRLACRCNCSLNRYGDWDQQLLDLLDRTCLLRTLRHYHSRISPRGDRAPGRTEDPPPPILGWDWTSCHGKGPSLTYTRAGMPTARSTVHTRTYLRLQCDSIPPPNTSPKARMAKGG
jgi:hypothetical protein